MASMPQEGQRPIYPAGGLLFPADPPGGSPWAPGPTLTQGRVEPVVDMEIYKENRERSGRKWLE